MRRLLIVAIAAVFAAGVGFAVAQTPAAKPAAPSAPSVQTAARKPRVSTPSIPKPGFAPPRPMDQMRAIYDFVGQHPEVLKFVPCYCGCESNGHPHNESCFVKSRDARGNVTEWDMHGFGCAICVDVARESMLMFNSGADAVAIRAAIEKKWTPKYQTKTPTPMPTATAKKKQ
jgi:hypothetical protein